MTMKQNWDVRKRVLLVAPRCRVAQALASILRRQGLVVDQAGGAEEAFARVDWTEYDVVIVHSRLDSMQQGSVVEFASFTRKHRPEALLIEISGCKHSASRDVAELVPVRLRTLRREGASASLEEAVTQAIREAVALADEPSPSGSGLDGPLAARE